MARMQLNGLGYPLVGGTRPRHIAGINSKPGEVPENAQTPTPHLHCTKRGAVQVCPRRSLSGIRCNLSFAYPHQKWSS